MDFGREGVEGGGIVAVKATMQVCMYDSGLIDHW